MRTMRGYEAAAGWVGCRVGKGRAEICQHFLGCVGLLGMGCARGMGWGLITENEKKTRNSHVEQHEQIELKH